LFPKVHIRVLNRHVKTRTGLFWFTTHRVEVVHYRSFGTISRVLLQGPKTTFGLLNLEVGTDMLSRNVGKELPLVAE